MQAARVDPALFPFGEARATACAMAILAMTAHGRDARTTAGRMPALPSIACDGAREYLMRRQQVEGRYSDLWPDDEVRRHILIQQTSEAQ